MPDFWFDTRQKIRERLIKESPKARESGDKINGINCPECGEPSGFAHSNEPNAVMCHRNNQCGANTNTRDMYPDLFADFGTRFKKTTENPRATSEAFLQARGLDTEKFSFSQGSKTEKGKLYQAVEIKFNGVTFHRLIDYKGSNKTRLTKYKGKYFSTKSADDAEKVFVVEGIFDALSLEQSGIPAIATLSSGHNPESCFKEQVTYVLAFDNDVAGIKAVKKISKYLDESGHDYSIALPPKGKDWNDLLVSGDLSKDRLEATQKKCLWRGQLAMATNAVDFFKIYHTCYPYSRLVFEFHNQTYQGTHKELEGEPAEYSVKRWLDCSLSIAYSIEDASLQYESRLSHIVNAQSNREGTNRFRLKGSDFSSANEFKAKLLQYRLLFFGNSQDLTFLAEYLFRKKPIKVRECQALGYDSISDCYVFNKFIYDKDGKHHDIDKDGYFHKQKLKPFSGQDKSITNISQIDVGSFIANLHNAYGDKGLLALGFWVSTTFSHTIFDKFGFFPFMSFHGEPHCGKSDLTTTLNRCFYVDSEGLPMSTGNTKKGEMRLISQKSSMVTAMLEGRKDKSRFDYDSILPLYNRNSLQVRAQTTNDNQVHDLKFTGALAFVQNIEQFISKPAKERVISIKFKVDGLEATFDSWKKLKTYSPEQLAGVGNFVITNRQYFEKNITNNINETAVYLSDKGVRIDRIAKNHAIAYAGIKLLIEQVKPDIKHELLDFTFDSAMTKIQTARSELPLADHFMECIADFSEKDGVFNNEHFLIVDMPRAIQMSGESWNKSELFDELKKLDTFQEQKTTRVFDKLKPKKCWHFKTEKHGLQSYNPGKPCEQRRVV